MRSVTRFIVAALTMTITGACGQILDADKWETDPQDTGEFPQSVETDSTSVPDSTHPDRETDEETDTTATDSESDTGTDIDSDTDTPTDSDSDSDVATDSDTSEDATACTSTSQCGDSQYCVDGYCCDTPCDEDCRSCGLAGTEGICTFVDAMTDPDDDCPLCQTCNGDGRCVFVPAGEDYSDECTDAGRDSCGQNGTCDGVGSCALYSRGTRCGDTTCANVSSDDSILIEYKCDGRGACTLEERTCGGYLCNFSLNGCLTVCANDTHCVTDFECDVQNKCVGDRGIGEACWLNSECASGFCADGHCCDTACAAACWRCDKTDFEGICSIVADNTDPSGDCPACYACQDGACREVPAMTDPLDACMMDPDPLGCGLTGDCNGQGACAYRGDDWSCGAQDCQDNPDSHSVFSRHHCDGAGTCIEENTSCGTFLCGPDQTCLDTCENDDQCVGDSVCSFEECTDEKADGELCERDFECLNGHCADGVCCASACDGTCERCDGAGTQGTCLPVEDGEDPDNECGICAVCREGTCQPVAAGDDPKNDCIAADPGVCGRTGVCNAVGACDIRGNDYLCDTLCTEDQVVDVYCSGAIGECNAYDVDDFVSCPDNYGCHMDGTVCLDTCETGSDCAPGYYCDADGNCLEKREDALACDADGECQSGFCTDGLCCDQRCRDLCESCGLTGSEGTCAPIPENTDPDDECPVCYACNELQQCAALNAITAPTGDCEDDGICGHTGMCVQGGCQWVASGHTCGDPVCENGTDTESQLTRYQCDGSGECLDIVSNCGAYTCASQTTCATTCGDNTDCIGEAWCNDTVCTDSKLPGVNCASGTECESGHCVNGVCCTQTECGACERCDISGDGTCAAVADATDPDNDCAPCHTCMGGSCTAVADGTDPDNDCDLCHACYVGNCNPVPAGADPRNNCTADPSPTGCGLDGTCNGSGACALKDATYLCNETCDFPMMYDHFCNGSGGCQRSDTGYYCDDHLACQEATDACSLSQCATDADCAPNSTYYCNTGNGMCEPKRNVGDACSANAQCQGNRCVEGVCCNSECNDTCQSCLATWTGGEDGNCGFVLYGNDPTGACGDDSWCNGDDYCDGSGACTHSGDPCSGGDACNNHCTEGQPGTCVSPQGTLCGDTHDGNPCQNSDTCDGAGTCVDTRFVAAGTTCDDGLFCTQTDTCDGSGACGGIGDPCAGGGQCANHCDETLDTCYRPAGTPCDDEVFCTFNDQCDGEGHCHGPDNTCGDTGTCLETEERCDCPEGLSGDYCENCVVFVDGDTTGVSDGETWMTAFASIAEGIASALDRKCSEVWVADGIYVTTDYPAGTLHLAADVQVYGGFLPGAGSLDMRDPQANRTVLDGNDTGRVVTCDNTLGCNSSTVLDGVYILRGNDTTDGIGSGLLVTPHASEASPLFANVHIADNEASTAGGGVWLDGGSPLFSGCTIAANRAPTGGGVYARGTTDAQFFNTVLAGNVATNDGAGIMCDQGSTVVLTNTMIAGNRGYSGGGMAIGNDGTNTISVINGTVAYNRAQKNGGGIYAIGDVDVVNSVVWDNQAANLGTDVYTATSGSTHVSYSNMSDYTYTTQGEGNIATDPMFILGQEDHNRKATYMGTWDAVFFDADTVQTVLVDRDRPRFSGTMAGMLLKPTTEDTGIFQIDDNDGYEVRISGDITDHVIPGMDYLVLHLGISVHSPLTDAGLDAVAPDVDLTGYSRWDTTWQTPGVVTDMGAMESRNDCVVFQDYSRPDNTGDGSWWTEAFKDVQSAIDAAADLAATAEEGYCEVWMHYHSTAAGSGVQMKNNVHLLGGFDGTEHHRLQADWIGNGHSVISGRHDGSAAGTIMTCSGSAGAGQCGTAHTRIEGIALTHADGSATDGGGLLISGNAAPQIRHCAFLDNTAINRGAGVRLTAPGDGMTFFDCRFANNRLTYVDPTYGGYGAAVYATGTSATLAIDFEYSQFTQNQSTYVGGGIGINGAFDTDIHACDFTGNNATGRGGAIWHSSATGGTITVSNSRFMANWVGEQDPGAHCDTISNWAYGGAMYLGGGSTGDLVGLVVNSVFHDNRASTNGGAISAITSTDITLVHNTFNSNCVASTTSSMAGDVGTSGTLNALSSVFFNGLPNEGGSARRVSSSASVQVHNCFMTPAWTGGGTDNLDDSHAECNTNEKIFIDRATVASPNLTPGFNYPEAGSPSYSCLVNAADGTGKNGAPSRDIVGVPRGGSPTIPTPEFTGSFYDMGAYELSVEEHCADGIDNNGNGRVDCLDPTCDGRKGPDGVPCAQREICDDGVDNTGNGRVDCPSITAANPPLNAAGPGTDVEFAMIGANSGDIYQCRSGHVNQVATLPWVPCDGNAGTSAEHTPVLTREGVSRTEMRIARNDGTFSDVATHDYYIHHSMTSVPRCNFLNAGGEPIPDQTFFQAAENIGLPRTGQFAHLGPVSVRSPFIHLPLNPPGSSFFQVSDGLKTVAPLSLRHRFALDDTGEYVLMIRHYASRRNDSNRCRALRVRVHDSHGLYSQRDTFRNDHCDAIVMNAHGAAVCLAVNSGAVDLSNKKNAPAPWGTSSFYNGAVHDVHHFMWRTLNWGRLDNKTNTMLRSAAFSPKCIGSGCSGGNSLLLELTDKDLFPHH